MRIDTSLPNLLAPSWRDASAAAGFAAWRCDLDDNERLTWEPGVFAMFGFAPGDEPDRRDALQLYDADSRVRLERLRTQALATGGDFTLGARIIRHDGTVRWIRIAAAAVRRQGRCVALTGVKRDITEQVMRRGGVNLARG